MRARKEKQLLIMHLRIKTQMPRHKDLMICPREKYGHAVNNKVYHVHKQLTLYSSFYIRPEVFLLNGSTSRQG